jgi:hypothetical protein
MGNTAIDRTGITTTFMENTIISYGKTGPATTLPALEFKAVTVQFLLLLTAAFVLPAAAHASGLPVRVLLPMHWPVLLVGLCYGWRSGLLVGLAAPGLSFLLSGHPLPHILPAMTIELAAYGFFAGFLRQRLHIRAFYSTAAALIGGRIVFIGSVFAMGAVSTPFAEYLKAAMIPGLAAVAAQAILLPPLAEWWVRREQHEDKEIDRA